MTIGQQDYYLDLLFYHRRLARLIAVDLKLGRFEAAYKGQMELYLRWLEQYERRSEHEESPLGLILCSAKDEEQIELLQLNQGEIRVAEYLTALPAKEVLAAKLQEAVRRVREQLAQRSDALNTDAESRSQMYQPEPGRGQEARMARKLEGDLWGPPVTFVTLI